MDKSNKTYNEKDSTNLKVVIGLYRSQTELNRKTQKNLTKVHLTLAQFGVLEALYHLGDLRINEIIQKTLSTSGNVTVVIKNLEKDQLIERYSDPKDSRVCIIHLTKKGEDLIQELFPKHLEQIERDLSNLSLEEKKTLIELFKKLNGLTTNKEM